MPEYLPLGSFMFVKALPTKPVVICLDHPNLWFEEVRHIRAAFKRPSTRINSITQQRRSAFSPVKGRRSRKEQVLPQPKQPLESLDLLQQIDDLVLEVDQYASRDTLDDTCTEVLLLKSAYLIHSRRTDGYLQRPCCVHVILLKISELVGMTCYCILRPYLAR